MINVEIEDHAAHCCRMAGEIVITYKGSAWVPAGTHAPDREIYLSAKP